jgi:hypothetical protein
MAVQDGSQRAAATYSDGTELFRGTSPLVAGWDADSVLGCRSRPVPANLPRAPAEANRSCCFQVSTS